MKGTLAERLLRVLAHASDDRGRIARTHGDLAEELGTSIRQVRRSAADLVAAGLLAVDRPAQRDGRYSPKVYRLATHPLDRVTPQGVTRGPRSVTYPPMAPRTTSVPATAGREAV